MGSSSGERPYADMVSWCWPVTGGTGEYTYDNSGSERFQGRSWGAAKKVPYFTTLSRILVVIRAPEKMLIGFLVSNEGCSLRQPHANM